MTKPQNINLIANYLLSKGANKNSVIGVLINMGTESGWDVYADEKPGAPFYYYGQGPNHGFALVQYSYLPIVGEIYNYNNSGHTEAECIKHECDILWDEMGLTSSEGASWASWIAPQYGLTDIQSYWANVAGLSAQECTQAWWACFERGGLNGYQRWNNPGKGWDVVSQYVDQWDGNVPDLGGDIVGPSQPTDPEEPEKKQVRKLSLQECLAFLDKLKPTNNGGTTTDPIGPDGPGPVTPPKPGTDGQARVWALFDEGRNAGLVYSMDYRYNWPNYADCSAFVTRCVHAYLNMGPPTSLCTTESEHDYITALGWHLVYEGDKSAFPLDVQEADIIITGKKGYSAGAAGHTLWVCDSAGNTIECTGIPATPPYGDGNYLCKSTVQAQRDVWLTERYWYLYRYGG